MKLGPGIHKHGFRKWYERELLQSHAHLTLTFLCAIGIVAAFEAASKFHTVADKLTDLFAALVCAGVGLWALRRYLWLLAHAEAAANQAECAQCGTYGRLALVHQHHHAHAHSNSVAVRCKQCEHEWRIQS
jgi:ABC-type nickel/cobalt efflux system permease component RcnA